LEKVDQLGTQIFALRIEQKFKDCTIQQSAACKRKTLLAFNEVLQALGGTTYTPIPFSLDSSSL
jgi:hypothetical protein